MSDRHEPDWDAMANQRLYAYLDSCDPLCEDCECEDPEHAEMVLRDLANDDAQMVECTCKCHNIPHDPREDGD